jgi:hypothetical protein
MYSVITRSGIAEYTILLILLLHIAESYFKQVMNASIVLLHIAEALAMQGGTPRKLLQPLTGIPVHNSGLVACRNLQIA